MKTLGKIKLNQLCKIELEQREMKVLRGGCGDRCSCEANNCKTADATSANSNNTNSACESNY